MSPQSSIVLDSGPDSEGSGASSVTPPAGGIVFTTVDGQSTAVLPTLAATVHAPSTHQTRTVIAATITHHVPDATASATNSAAASSSSKGLPLSTLIPAVAVPVVVLLIAIPLGIWFFFRQRAKRLDKESRRISTPDMRGPPTQTALLAKAPAPTASPISYDGEKSFNSGMGVYNVRHSLERNHGESIAMYPRNRSSSRDSSARAPSPTLPSPSLTKRASPRPPTQDNWPLPAHATLPSPVRSPAADQSEHQLPPIGFAEPLSMNESLKTDSSIYDMSATAMFPEPPTSSSHGILKSKRESDLVSEISDDDDDDERTPGKNKRDTDAISMVSAITSRSRSQKRKSNRDTDALSVISAISPGFDEPEMPMQPFPRR